MRGSAALAQQDMSNFYFITLSYETKHVMNTACSAADACCVRVPSYQLLNILYGFIIAAVHGGNKKAV